MITDDQQLVLPGQRMLADEWHRNRDGDRPVSRDAMQPRRFLCQLAHISIIEDSADELRFRLCGSEICRRLGSEPRGRRLSEFDVLASEPFWRRSVSQVLESRVLGFGVNELEKGRRHFWLRLPMCDEFGQTRLVLCHDRILDEAGLQDELTAQLRKQAA